MVPSAETPCFCGALTVWFKKESVDRLRRAAAMLTECGLFYIVGSIMMAWWGYVDDLDEKINQDQVCWEVGWRVANSQIQPDR